MAMLKPTTLIACVVQAADAICRSEPGAHEGKTLETYTNRLKQLRGYHELPIKGVEKSFAIQAGTRSPHHGRSGTGDG